MPHVTSHLPHARTIGSRFFAAHAQNAYVLCAQVPVRADLDLSHIGEVPRLDKQSTDPQHLQRFWHSRRHAGALDHYVRTAAISKVTNHLQAFIDTRLASVDDVIGA